MGFVSFREGVYLLFQEFGLDGLKRIEQEELSPASHPAS